MLLSCCEHLKKNKSKPEIDSTMEQKDLITTKVVQIKDEKLQESTITTKLDNSEGEINKEHGQSTKDTCFLCMRRADKFCKRCLLPYCSQAHYDLHTTSNINGPLDEVKEEYCFPFRVLERPQVGRYVVATRDISPMELILSDEPAVFGPNHDSSPACLECLLPLNKESVYPCPNCGLPLCVPDSHCGVRRKENPEKGHHAKGECQPFSTPTPTGFKMSIKLDRPIPAGCQPVGGRCNFIAPEYGCITPLRMLRLKQTQPHTWQRLNLLMDHDIERKQETEYQKMFQVNVVDFLRKVCGFDYSEEEIFRVIGILRTNAIMVQVNSLLYAKSLQDPIMKKYDVGGRAVYPTFSFMSHSCISNATYSIVPVRHNIVLRAQTPIKKGEEITVQYLSFMYGQCRRKKEIPSFWFFDCRCVRCMDPTDCGSLVSAILCQHCISTDCEDGTDKMGESIPPVLPDDPFNVIDGTWSCRKCGFKQQGKTAEEICENAADELTNTLEHDIGRYKELLKKFSEVLHPNNYIMMTLKKYIADSYGSLEGYKFHQLSLEQLELKIKYSEEFLRVLGMVDPGVTKWRGTLLYDLHSALMWKANLKFAKNQNSQVTKQDNVEPQSDGVSAAKDASEENDVSSAKGIFLKELKTIEGLLKESIQCLQYEADNTKEGYICKAAKKALGNVGEIIFFSDFI